MGKPLLEDFYFRLLWLDFFYIHIKSFKFLSSTNTISKANACSSSIFFHSRDISRYQAYPECIPKPSLPLQRLQVSCLHYRIQFTMQHFTHSKDIASTYDYVIIGGGTAGLTVADRLTEDGNCWRTPLLIWSQNYSPNIYCSYRSRGRVRLLRTKHQF
jgi:hypothetical protein